MRKLRIVAAALIIMLLAFVGGSVPASAGIAVGGRPDWPVVAFELLQPGSSTGLTANARERFGGGFVVDRAYRRRAGRGL